MDQWSVDPAVCGDQPVGVPSEVSGNKVTQEHACPVVLEYPGIRNPYAINFPEEISPAPCSPRDLKPESNNNTDDEITGVSTKDLADYFRRIHPAEDDSQEDNRDQEFDGERDPALLFMHLA